MNRTVLIALGVAAVGILVLSPNLSGVSALPILLLLACPLSMVLMMRRMSGAKPAAPEATPPASDTPGEIARLQEELDGLQATKSADQRPAS